jgi:hypothetical protein
VGRHSHRTALHLDLTRGEALVSSGVTGARGHKRVAYTMSVETGKLLDYSRAEPAADRSGPLLAS